VSGKLVKIKDDSNNVLETYIYGARQESAVMRNQCGEKNLLRIVRFNILKRHSGHRLCIPSLMFTQELKSLLLYLYLLAALQFGLFVSQ